MEGCPVKVLHIIATPRGRESNTLKVSQEFLNSLIASYDDLTIETMDLYREDLPAVAGDNIESRYQLMVGRPIDPDHEDSWKFIAVLIDHFLEADLILISTPMWNFSIPYALKYYIDCLVQPGYTFSYNAEGAFGMVRGRRLVVVTSRGNDYSLGGPMHPYDFQEPYLRHIFGFIGFEDIEFINAQPMDVDKHRREVALQQAGREARELGAKVTAGSAVRV
jgi:FMN-dependent NADH-azoreductase